MQNSKNKKIESNETKPKRRNEDSQLEEFFMSSLKDIYWAEKHLTKAIPKMIEASTTEELRNVFKEHLQVTVEQVTQVEKVFDLMGEKPQAQKCDAMEGLTKEAESNIEKTQEGSLTRDVALIMAAQKVEHYEIATYGTLVRLATAIGRLDAAGIFSDLLDEEKEADTALTGIAANNINMEATHEEKA
ncbi:MAG TPA: ferritin-like domain-containing protein [Cyclobacteriaceae bacterium]|jgi:ferritin-like metal-binding protein YciE|nr:ferritin-like domain-containing protein [Cyclobacteriaceae bacterium]